MTPIHQALINVPFDVGAKRDLHEGVLEDVKFDQVLSSQLRIEMMTKILENNELDKK